MIKNDKWIIEQSEKGMISPFSKDQINKIELHDNDNFLFRKIISYGTSSYGYDIRLDDKLKIVNSEFTGIIDPKNLHERVFYNAPIRESHKGELFFLIPPHGFALGTSLETFDIPRNILSICVGKSTYARCGLIVNVTPLEPAWKGKLTLEFSNTTDLSIKIYVNEGIAQLCFFEGEDCEISYADRNGKYQNQTEITLPTV